MAKNFLVALLLIIALGCKKKVGDDDTTPYKWKRDLYRARVKNDGPATFNSKDPSVARNSDAIFLNTSYTVLTEHRKNEQQDSIFNASGRTLVYKYEKVDN
ncbi:hypothetical protein [Pedobacter sp. UBA5917]|jgi:hypothetical protein|uniref:hypothetical protein n=1 Tax=Pedobacter sp. UBA5917 TaxID=1947061 RepID=UPI0025F8872D|nr:hypothetical protein [Pedobacter sp. UBA5917]